VETQVGCATSKAAPGYTVTAVVVPDDVGARKIEYTDGDGVCAEIGPVVRRAIYPIPHTHKIYIAGRHSEQQRNSTPADIPYGWIAAKST